MGYVEFKNEIKDKHGEICLYSTGYATEEEAIKHSAVFHNYIRTVKLSEVDANAIGELTTMLERAINMFEPSDVAYDVDTLFRTQFVFVDDAKALINKVDGK